MAQKKTENLHARIKEDAGIAIDHLIADKVRKRDYGPNLQQAEILADCADEVARDVVRHLLKHYTIRDRNR